MGGGEQSRARQGFCMFSGSQTDRDMQPGAGAPVHDADGENGH